MVVMKACTLVMMTVAVACAYPYFDLNKWSPQEIAEFLYQRAIEETASPVEDTSFDTDNQGIGSVSAVDIDSNGDVFVFHRADKPWGADTYEPLSDILSATGRVPISKDTIYKLNPVTGRLIQSFGANFFNVPHGLKVDQNDNLWVTDVGRHQIFRFPRNSSSPDLVLGEKFIPGDDDTHFCKPTDVVVASNGDFFVADGYCNSRVLKFSKDGQVIAKWGTETMMNVPLTPFSLKVPHSVTLVEELDIVCVADRENSRALCYNAGLSDSSKAGSFNRTLIPQDDISKVYAIYYNKADKEIIAASEISQRPVFENGDYIYPARAFTYGLDGQQQDDWAFITPAIANNGPTLIHDLCASKDGQEFFLADLIQQKVFKYTKMNDAVVG